MKKRYTFLKVSAMFLLALVMLTACTDKEDLAPSVKPGIMLTIEAGTGANENVVMRANLTEEDDTNPWIWETDDKLLVVTEDGKALDVVTLVSGAGKRAAKFQGTIDGITDKQPLYFYYLGPNTSKDIVEDGKIGFDFTAQNGKREDLKNFCALMGKGVVKMSENGAHMGRVELKNLFAAAHFNIKANTDRRLGTDFTRLAMRGKNLFLTAHIDLKSHKAVGDDAASIDRNLNKNIIFEKANMPGDSFDFYTALVPSDDETYISFDIYTKHSYSDEIVKKAAVPMTGATADNSFLKREDGSYAEFTVDPNGKKVRFTRGNLQYYLPIQLYSATIKKKIEPNKLYFKGKDKPVVVKLNYTLQSGVYKFADHQTDILPTTYKSKTPFQGTYDCAEIDGKWYVRGTDNKYLDMFIFGDPAHPASMDVRNGKYFVAPKKKMQFQNTQYDWGYEYVKVDNKPTFTLGADEWAYLMHIIPYYIKRKCRRFDTGERAMALAVWDVDGDGKLDYEKDRVGMVIFPDGMREQEARNLFIDSKKVKFGPGIKIAETQIIKYDAFFNSGSLWLPFVGWCSGADTDPEALVQQINKHLNYCTSSTYGNTKSIEHIKFGIKGVGAHKNEKGANAVRLAQEIK